MSFRLLLADPLDPAGGARALKLQQQLLLTSPGGEDVTVSFRPNRSDDLYASAKTGAQLAYRILHREGIVRSQLVVRYQLSEGPANVVGRSADLLFALAVMIGVYEEGPQNAGRAHAFPAVAATGVLESDGTVRAVDHLADKVRAAVEDTTSSPAVVFFPAENLVETELNALRLQHPHVKLVPVTHVDQALEDLGIALERVYLRNPFRGLEHFDYEHRAVFFERDAAAREFVQQLLRRERAGTPGALVEGPSGSGKSSFLRAAVLPAIVDPRRQPPEVREALRCRPPSSLVHLAIWRPGLMAPAIDERGVARSILDCWSALSEGSKAWPDPSVENLSALAEHRRQLWPKTLRFVWVVDQFEEALTSGLAGSVLDALGRFLLELQADGVWTLASIRADAMPQLKGHELLRRVFGANEGQYYLATLSGFALDGVINLPAKAADLRFGVGPEGKRLDQLLREEAFREPDSLPLLQFTLNELYLKRSGNELTYSAYRQLGGLAGSITTTAAAVLNTNDPESRRAVPRVFRSLVGVDDSGRASRRYARIAEIRQDPPQKTLLDRLVKARLCVTDQRDGEPVVAFAHDAVLWTLPALTDWLKEETGFLQTRELAQRETQLWQQHGKLDAWLASADKLIAFKALDAAAIGLSDSVREFIARSERQVRRFTRLKRTAVSLIALLALAATVAAWVASVKKREAEYQAAETLKSQSRLLTDAAAERLKDSDVAGAQGIILEVLTNPEFAQDHTPAAISVFQEIRAADAQLAVLSGHGDLVNSAAYSPDGTRIVTASFDKTARIWDARTGAQLAVLSGHGDVVTSAAYSPDGTRIVTASFDKTARIWDARTRGAARRAVRPWRFRQFRRLLARRHAHRHRVL